jgi:hypothetical protein
VSSRLPAYIMSSINFLASYPPLICAQRLHLFAQQHTSLLMRTRLSLKRLKDGSVRFELYQSHYDLPLTLRIRRGGVVHRKNYTKVLLTGYFIHWADPQTALVMGDAAIMDKTFWVNAFALAVLAGILLALVVALPYTIAVCVAPIGVLALLSFTRTTVFQPEVISRNRLQLLILKMKDTLT